MEKPFSAEDRVAAELAASGVPTQIRRFDASTRTAAEAANAIGTRVGQIVKSLVFVARDQPVLALVSGSNQLDTDKLGRLVGEPVDRADAATVRRATSFAIGGVPPLGFPGRIPTYIDRDLFQYDVVWAAAGTPHHVFKITPADLARISGGTPADLKRPTEQT